jgi:hypothetical protein
MKDLRRKTEMGKGKYKVIEEKKERKIDLRK